MTDEAQELAARLLLRMPSGHPEWLTTTLPDAHEDWLEDTITRLWPGHEYILELSRPRDQEDEAAP